MKRIFTFLLSLCLTFHLSAQLSDGSQAPDFDLPDLGGTNHSLYSYLEDGYSAILDFSATWCPPCWSYHESGILEDIYDDYDDKVIVFMIEADPNTNMACIYGQSGCNNTSLGDWTDVPYPVLNPDSGGAAEVNSDFNINYFPTLYGVAPNGEIYEFGQAGYSTWESWVAFSFQMHNTTFEVIEDDCEVNIDLRPEGGEGNIDYLWSNGETTEDLFDVLSGDYFVTMTDENGYQVELGPIKVLQDSDAIVFEIEEVGNLICGSDENGYIDMNYPEGTDDYSFEWSDGSTDEDLFDVSAGEYGLTITNINTDCAVDIEVDVDGPEELSYEIDDLQNPECGSGQQGYVEFFIEGGTPPIFIQFEEFETTDELIYLDPGLYTPTIVDGNECALFTELIVIEETDAPEAYSSANGNLNCINNIVTLSIDSSSTGSNIQYSWYGPDSLFISNLETIDVIDSGQYTLQVSDNNNGCVTESITMVEEYSDVPNVIIQPSNSLDCNNPTSVLSVQNNVDSVTMYEWMLDGVSLQMNTPSITATTPGNYSVSATNVLSGCSDNNSIQMDAIDLPQVEITGANQICEGETAQLCVDVNTGYSISWSINGQEQSTSNCIDIVSSNEIIATLTDDQTGCQGAEAVTVDVLSAPIPVLSGDLNFCQGESSIICIEGSDVINVEWRNNANSIGTDNCIEINTQDNFEIVLTDFNGCQGYLSFSTQIEALPTLNIISSPVIDCNNTTATLQAGTNASSVEWYNNEGNLIGSSSSIEVNEGGEYVVAVTSDAGCLLESSVMIDEDDTQLPTSLFESEKEELVVRFTNQSSGTIDNFVWEFGDGESSNQMNPTHTYLEDGEYAVKLINENKCGEVTYEEVIQVESATTSVNNIPNLSKFDINPNPAVDVINIDLEYSGSEKLNYQILNLKGEVINNLNQRSVHDLSIDISDYASGVYIFKVTSQSKIALKRFIIL